MRFVTFLCLMALAITVSAHQQKEAYTTVLFNIRSGNIEVAHQFLIHDAEHALAEVNGSEADILLNSSTQQEFGAYVVSHFGMRRSDGSSMKLKSLGVEIEGKYIWVYQEAPLEDIEQLEIIMTALQEVWPSQINHINMEKNGRTRSLRLKTGDDWQSLSLKD